MIDQKNIQAPATYVIPSYQNVMRVSIDSEHLDNMIRFSEKHIETNFDRDNLVGRKRTDWLLNHKEGFHEAFKPMIDKLNFILHHYIDTDASFGSSQLNLPESAKIRTILFDCWTAWFEQGGATLPHAHGNIPTHFSTVLYLRLPKGKTSLGFGNNTLTQRVIHDIREGDMLIFPSSLVHWGFDHDEGRIMTSANWTYTIDYPGLET